MPTLIGAQIPPPSTPYVDSNGYPTQQLWSWLYKFSNTPITPIGVQGIGYLIFDGTNYAARTFQEGSTKVIISNADGTDGDTTIDINDDALQIKAAQITDVSIHTGSQVSGNNTGDQTINLTGDVTGTGMGDITTTLTPTGVSSGNYKINGFTFLGIGIDGRISTAQNVVISDLITYQQAGGF